MATSVFIAGDIVPMGRTVSLFKEKNTTALFGNIVHEINKSDIKIVNLECPVISGALSPISKNGPTLYTTKETLDVIAEAGFNVVTLANNHFFDQGQKGVDETMDLCSANGIKTVGGGKTKREANAILTIQINDVTISFINACEYEFSIASEEHGGSNPLDICQIDENILTAKKDSDYVIVIIHGGVEHYPLPTPRMKQLYRHFINMGADAIVNHHQHCFSGYEVFEDKPIFYGLGNFCFDNMWKNPMPLWQKGYAVRLLLDRGKVSFETIPYEQCGKDPKVSLRNHAVFDNEIEILNASIKDDCILRQKFNDYVIDHEFEILESLQPHSFKLWAAAFRRGWFGKVYNHKKILKIRNRLYCESHLDVLKQLFMLYTK